MGALDEQRRVYFLHSVVNAASIDFVSSFSFTPSSHRNSKNNCTFGWIDNYQYLRRAYKESVY